MAKHVLKTSLLRPVEIVVIVFISEELRSHNVDAAELKVRSSELSFNPDAE